MDSRIRIVLTIIKESDGDVDLRLTSAAELLGLSGPHLHRLFKRDVGMSLASYLRETRMARAAVLLADYGLAVKIIALDCGYDDISNFYRDFRKVHGTTPRQLRNDQLLTHGMESLVCNAPSIELHARPASPLPGQSQRQSVSGLR